MCTHLKYTHTHAHTASDMRTILSHAHEILSRAHQVLSRAHQILSRAQQILSREHQILSHEHQILSRAHEKRIFFSYPMSLYGFRSIRFTMCVLLFCLNDQIK